MIDDLKINETLRERWYAKGYWTHDTIRDVWERQAQSRTPIASTSATTREAASPMEK